MSNCQIEKLESIKEFSKLTTENMYNAFELSKGIVKLEEDKINYLATERGISVQFNTQYNVSHHFKSINGFYLNTSRLFISDKHRVFVWYKVKECISEYYTVENAEIHPTHIKALARLKPYENDFKLSLQREFKSGQCKYDVDDASLYLIHLVQTVTENFKGV